jgi:hypothetical protein
MNGTTNPKFTARFGSKKSVHPCDYTNISDIKNDAFFFFFLFTVFHETIRVIILLPCFEVSNFTFLIDCKYVAEF